MAGRKPKRLECRFSHAWLDKLPVPVERREWWDTEARGLQLRLGASGSKAFYFFGKIHGRATRMKLGNYPDLPLAAARREVQRIRGEAAQGTTPRPAAATEARDELTLADLFAWYLRTHARPHKRTWKEDESRYARELAHWGLRRLSTITVEMVKDLHVEIEAREGRTDKGHARGGPYAANKMLELLGVMWRLGQRQLQITAPDPTQGIKRFPKHDRERYLTEDELPMFFAAVESLQREVSRDFILMALFTGARRANVAAMRWDQIDLNSGIWTIPREHSKNKASMRVILAAPAIEILKRREVIRESPWVFPGKGDDGHYNDPQGAMNNINSLMTSMLGYEVGLRLHDLRRTLGSWQAAQGTSLQIIGKSLGHQSMQSTRIYARLSDDPVRAAVESATLAMEAMRPKNSEK